MLFSASVGRLLILAGIALPMAAACGSGDIGDPTAAADAAAAGAIDAGGVDGPLPAVDARPVDATPPADAPPCDDGTLNVVDPLTGHCYMYFDQEAPWTIALGACAALPGDAHLATISSAGENAVVAMLDDGQDDSWLGASDGAVEMTWVWVTGEPFIYDNWRDGEPNNGGSDIPEEDCMIIEIDTLDEWDDRPCDFDFTYICERD